MAMVPLLLALLLAGCSSTREVPGFVRSGCINNPVRDTLFITVGPDYEDETCTVEVQHLLVDFKGREVVHNGKVFFDIRTFPAGQYTVWIRLGDLYFKQRFMKL
jgi:hypothetical protein